jgi:rhamnose transport system substrate-binding protein
LKLNKIILAAVAAGLLAAIAGCKEKEPDHIRIAMVVKTWQRLL